MPQDVSAGEVKNGLGSVHLHFVAFAKTHSQALPDAFQGLQNNGCFVAWRVAFWDCCMRNSSVIQGFAL